MSEFANLVKIGVETRKLQKSLELIFFKNASKCRHFSSPFFICEGKSLFLLFGVFNVFDIINFLYPEALESYPVTFAIDRFRKKYPKRHCSKKLF